MARTPLRRGFTLVELLVATGVFVIGFAAVFTLFLSGMRFRKLADDTTLTATLASSLLTEIYLDSGKVGSAGPASPAEYDGSGLVSNPDLIPATWREAKLYAYAGVPGAVYRLENTSDLTGAKMTGAPDNAEMTTAIVTDVVALCPGGTVETFDDLNRRLRIIGSTAATQPPDWDDADPPAAFADELVRRGIAMRYKAVIVRQPHWMP